ASYFLTRRQIEAKDPLPLADRQAPAVRAECVRPASAQLVTQGRFPVGHVPHPQPIAVSQRKQESLIGTEVQVLSQDGFRSNALDLSIVGDSADADGPLAIRASPELVLSAIRQHRGAGGGGLPARDAA